MHGRHGHPRDHKHPHKKGKGSHPHHTSPHSTPSSSIDDDQLMAELDADGEIPADLTSALAGLSVGRGNEGLNAKVLVLNKAYAAMRVVTARRAFVLLSRAIAEVIHVDPATAAGAPNASGGFINYDLESWIEISQLQREFEPDRHDWVRTVRMEIAVPRIIRLLGYDRLPEQTVKLNRRNLFARDRNKCQYCGRIFPTNDLSIDHVLPRAQGGGDSWENLVCACIRCNARKGGRTPEQAHMKLVKKPERPKRNPIIALKLGHEKYASWKAFLDHAYWDVELR
ncbi:MAG TPA: HNH endonuclease [Phycisphaerales bacterium]|nr:HNH endonuclease [Phycisphaerales bacterium]